MFSSLFPQAKGVSYGIPDLPNNAMEVSFFRIYFRYFIEALFICFAFVFNKILRALWDQRNWNLMHYEFLPVMKT